MLTQSEKAHLFRSLHHRPTAFIMPNPWDLGTAHLLAGLGFEALATTSAGYAFSIGQCDTTVGRDKMLAHVAEIASHTNLPVSADLENGYADDPAAAAETYKLAAAAGAVGASIEDASGDPTNPIYPETLSADRVRAAVEAVRALPFSFTLTARAENYINGRPDLKNTIKRLQLYQEAGADVLYAPGLTKKEDIAAVISSLDRPVNVLLGLRGVSLTLSDLSALGVKRISIGSALCRAAFGSFLRAAQEMRNQGSFSFAEEIISYQDLSAVFAPKTGS